MPDDLATTSAATFLSGPILPPDEPIAARSFVAATTATVATDKITTETLSLLNARFRRVLWERLRMPLFLFVLGIVFLVLLLFSLYSRRPTRWRSLTGRSLILSVIVHVILLLGLDSVVLSQRVLQTVREPEFQVLLDSDSLAEEKLSLEVREATTELPLADAALAAVPRPSDVPLPPPTPVGEKPMAIESRIDFQVLELPRDIAKPKPRDKEPSAPSLAARPVTDFRIQMPQVTLETPRLPSAAELPEQASAKPPLLLETIERPIASLTVPEIEKPAAAASKDPPLPSAPLLTTSLVGSPVPAQQRAPKTPELVSPKNLLVLPPSPKPLPAPIILEERPPSEEPYRLRKPQERAKVIEALGGSPETEEAVQRALRWLAAHQSDDGRWDIAAFDARCGKCGEQGEFGKQDMAATALATLAFLGAGHTHRDEGPYRETIARAIAWLVAQASKDGDLRGQGNMYDQGMATIALAESCGMTRDASLVPVVERACKFIASAQNRETGGWRYFPGEEGDTSVFGWQVMALKSASMAGVSIPEESLKLAERWLERIGGGQHGGLYGYQNKSPRPAMAAEGMFARQLLGWPPTSATMIETADYLRQHLPSNSDPNMYYWYYGTLALFQHQGPAWEQWNSAMRKALLSSQEKEGARKGSWPPRGQWGKQGGRLIETAMAALSLEVYYRYLPLYAISATSGPSPRRGQGRNVPQKTRFTEKDGPSGEARR